MSQDTAARVLTAAGLVTCAVAALPAVTDFVASPRAQALVWMLPLAMFVSAFLFTVKRERSQRAKVAGLLLQAVTGVVFAATARGGFAPALTAVVAGQAAIVLDARGAGLLVGAQTLALGVALGQRMKPTDALVVTGSYLGFQLFALGTSWLARRARAAHEEATRINAELLATRELFADATRTAERLRIARELHDAVGHHLTALRLQLEVAKNTTSDKHDAAVRSAAEIAKQLLEEVRGVVAAIREDTPVDLARALEQLIAGVPRPRVHLTIDPALRLGEPALSHALFRCVQETITNATRHASADNVWVDIAATEGAAALTVRDDGRGAAVVTAGHGLTGLRERVEELGGTLEIAAAPGKGVSVRALVPLRAGGA